MKVPIFRLNLLHPLAFYSGPDPEFSPLGETGLCSESLKQAGETLFCFELDDSTASLFEPERSCFPGTLIFEGSPAMETRLKAPAGIVFELPRGNYLFTQARERLSLDKIIALAMELQQEALWQRLKPAPRWYLRFLFEDESPVTQVFRPFWEEPEISESL